MAESKRDKAVKHAAYRPCRAGLGWIAAMLAPIVIAASGCKYQAGSLMPSNVRTIYVDAFDNVTFRRGLEIELTQAVQKEIRRRTNLKFVSKDSADSILSGEIVDFSSTVNTKDTRERVFSEDVTIYVNFRWLDRRSGRTLADGTRLSRTVRLYAELGETVPMTASESIKYLAEDVVDRMEGRW